MSYLGGSVAGIVVSWGMLRSSVFGWAAGYAGIAGNLVGLGLYIPTVGIFFGVVSGVVL